MSYWNIHILEGIFIWVNVQFVLHVFWNSHARITRKSSMLQRLIEMSLPMSLTCKRREEKYLHNRWLRTQNLILFVLDCDFGLRYPDHNLGVSKRHQSGTPNIVVNATASLLYSKFRIQNITKTKIHRVDTIKILCRYWEICTSRPQRQND